MTGDRASQDEHARAVVLLCEVGIASNPERPYRGEFEAHGPAVINGLVCPNGKLRGEFGGRQEGYFDFIVVHHLTCTGDGGGFSVRLQVKMYQPMHTYFEWYVTDGWGHHTGLTGGGSGVGTASRMGRDVITDHLFGHVDS